MSRCTRLAFALTLAAATGLAQRTWVVDSANGPGSHFTDIPPAVQAAQPGDTVRVLGTSSVAYSAFAVNKAIVVEAVAGATCGRVFIYGGSAGTTARVTGFRVRGGGSFFVEPAVWIQSCPGSVHLSGLDVSSPVTSYPLVSVSDSPDVLVTDCLAATSAFGTLLPALQAQRSGVVLQRCTVTGYAGSASGSYAFSGGPALNSASSSVVIVDSTMTGGAGGSGTMPTYCSADGGIALYGACIVLGASKISGGPGGAPRTGCPAPKQGPAADGAILLAADVAVAGPLLNGARVVRSLGWIESPGRATLGTPVTVKLRGAPFTGFLLHLDAGFSVTPVPPLETPYLGTAGALYLAPFVLGAVGTLPLTFTVPAVPGWAGRTLLLHALAVEPGTNAVSFTSLGDLVLR